MGYSPELINYSFMDEDNYSPLKQKRLRSFVASCMFYRLRKGICKQFALFRDNKMIYSRQRIASSKDIMEFIHDYDVLLIGSDQVWNPFLGFDIDLSLLSFYKSSDSLPKKVSYASSFGIDSLPEELRTKYKESLDDFSNLSTREESGSKIISNLIHRETPIVVDPTLLFSGEQWDRFSNSIDIDEDYVLIYDMQHSQKMYDAAKIISKTLKIKIYALSRITNPDKNITTLYNIGPDKFITLFKRARFVLTDSFHGAVFSVIFEKVFYCVIPKRRASRMKDFLKKISLESRLLSNDSENTDLSFDAIDYGDPNRILSQWRNYSLDYLRKALE